MCNACKVTAARVLSKLLTRLAAEKRKKVMPMRMGASLSWAATGAPDASSAPAAATKANMASLHARKYHSVELSWDEIYAR